MDFTDQMAAKLLAQTVRHLGQALNETLCVAPDKVVVRLIIDDAKRLLAEFEEAYFDCAVGDPRAEHDPVPGRAESDRVA